MPTEQNHITQLKHWVSVELEKKVADKRNINPILWEILGADNPSMRERREGFGTPEVNEKLRRIVDAYLQGKNARRAGAKRFTRGTQQKKDNLKTSVSQVLPIRLNPMPTNRN